MATSEQSTSSNKGGLFSGIFGGLSNLVSGYFGYKGQKSANKTNIQLARESRDHDVNMWNLQNQYNTPAMQMQRYKEAGLNPNLMYGQGNSGNASTPQKAPVPEVGNELASISQMSALPVISAYQDWRVKNAQIDNLNANAEATRQNASLTALRQITQDFTNKRLKIELPWQNIHQTNKASFEHNRAQNENLRMRLMDNTMSSQIQNIILRNSLLSEQTRGQSLENDLNEKLKPFGASSRDNLLQRLIMMYLTPKSGSKQPNILTNPKDHLRYSFPKLFKK